MFFERKVGVFLIVALIVVLVGASTFVFISKSGFRRMDTSVSALSSMNWDTMTMAQRNRARQRAAYEKDMAIARAATALERIADALEAGK